MKHNPDFPGLYKKDRLPLAGLIAALLAGLNGFLFNRNFIFSMDWGFFYQKFEAIRKSILEYSEFPFWNPWQAGGVPLFARPDTGVFSLETIMVLVFGTHTGLQAALAAYLIAGSLGMYLLLKSLKIFDRTLLVWGSLIFVLQGSFSMHIYAGHFAIIPSALFPWVILLFIKLKNSIHAALILGLILSLMVNSSIYYSTIFTLTILGVYLLFSLKSIIKEKEFRRNLLIMLLVFLALTSYRIIMTADMISDYSRTIDTGLSIPAAEFFKGMFIPARDPKSLILTADRMRIHRWEIGAYTGLLPLIFFMISFFKKPSRTHYAALLLILLSLNSSLPFLPGYWLRKLPGFTSMWVITRWRIFAVFYIAVCAVRGADEFLKGERIMNIRRSHILKALCAISIFGLIFNTHSTLNKMDKIRLKDARDAVAISSENIITSEIALNSYDLYLPATKKNVALLNSYENMLGYYTNYSSYSKRKGIENPDYAGEVTFNGKNIPAVWSPNRIIIPAPEKEGIIRINQNPGSYWLLDKKRLFPGERVFEMEIPFEIPVSGESNLTFRLKPDLHFSGLLISLTSGLLCLAFLYTEIRKKKLQLK